MTSPGPVNDDVDLMLRVKAGDWRSFTELWTRHGSSVERFLYARVRNRATVIAPVASVAILTTRM